MMYTTLCIVSIVAVVNLREKREGGEERRRERDDKMASICLDGSDRVIVVCSLHLSGSRFRGFDPLPLVYRFTPRATLYMRVPGN